VCGGLTVRTVEFEPSASLHKTEIEGFDVLIAQFFVRNVVHSSNVAHPK
jgi:hypothetical protein